MKGASIVTLEVESDEDTAYSVGTSSTLDQHGNVVGTAKYIVICKFDDGTWKLHRDIWNTNPGPVAK